MVLKVPFDGPAQRKGEMEASVPAVQALAAAGVRAGMQPARICDRSTLEMHLIPRTVAL